ncbi:MAG: hypothetical protein M3Y82_14290 [Verrucomicrobiota bacterium]|nr:hypothetical protein [Verrucomicrobiota bacterium]
MKVKSEIFSGITGVAVITLAGFLFVGCGKEEIKTYSVPKEKVSSKSAAKDEFPDSISKPVSTNAKKIPAAVGEEINSIEPTWEIPTNWKPLPASEMVLKSFLVDGKANISISAFPGDVGGALMNVNRWRGQLQLEAVEESDLPKLTSSIGVLGGKAMLADMKGISAKTGQPARLIAASVRRGEKTWFYKLMGDEKTVAQEKEAFLKFVQTVRYPND